MHQCIHCKDTGQCHFCHGSGKSGSFNCIHCGGTGKCNFCHGASATKSGGYGSNQAYGANPGYGSNQGYGMNQGYGGNAGYGSNQGYGGNPDEDEFDKGRRIAGIGIAKLQSPNPADRREGIEILDSHDAFFGRDMAAPVAVQMFPNETDPEVKAGLVGLAMPLVNKDPRVFQLVGMAYQDMYPEVRYAAVQATLAFKEKGATFIPQMRVIYQDPTTPSSVNRYMMRVISEMGKAGEPGLDIIGTELASKSWLMRKASREAVKRLIKKGVNMIGFLASQLESGDMEKKVAALTGIGELEKEAKGAVSACAKALSDPMPDVRAKAAWALGKMGKNASPAEAELVKALEDESPGVAKFALKALDNFKKLSKEQKEQIKAMEETEKEMKKYRKSFERIFPEPKEEKVDDKAPNFKATEQDVQNLVFMSHALPDFPWVQKAMQVIESWPGCKVWTCERDIPTGGDWLESIYDGLERCSAYVLFWSDKAQTSKWTNEEIREAKVRHVSKGKPLISVVNLGKNDWPTLLSRYQGSMITSDEQLQSWLMGLKTMLDNPPAQNPASGI